MDYTQNGTGKHRARASRPPQTSSESHRSDWEAADGFDHAGLPTRERRRGSQTQVPDDARKTSYYPPTSTRPRRASDALPNRSRDSLPLTPQSAGPRPSRVVTNPRNRAPIASIRTPSKPRRVVEEENESSDEEEDEDEDESDDSEDVDDDDDDDDDDVKPLPRSRAVSRARSTLRRELPHQRCRTPSSDGSQDTDLSDELDRLPRTPAARSRAVSRVRSAKQPSRPVSAADSDSDPESESAPGDTSESDVAPRRSRKGTPQRKQIEGVPVPAVSDLVRAKKTTTMKPHSRQIRNVGNGQLSDDSSSPEGDTDNALERLRIRQQPPEIQIAMYSSPIREHRRHHSDPKRATRKQDLSPNRRPTARRGPSSPKIYYSSQSSVNNFHRSHTAPSSYVTSRSAPTRRSNSTRRSATRIESQQTLQAVPRQRQPRPTCISCNMGEYLSDKLVCRHRICSSCLGRLFREATGTETVVSPSCPCGKSITLDLVDSAMLPKDKTRWNKHVAKAAARDRLFCPIEFCGVWIPPSCFDEEHQTGQCPQCHIFVCLACNRNMKAHKKSRCPALDTATKSHLDAVKRDPRHFCVKCDSDGALIEDNRQMECHKCHRRTCVVCDQSSGSCECPWFVGEPRTERLLPHLSANMPMIEPQVPEPPPIMDTSRSRRMSSSGRTNHSRASQHHEEKRRRRKQDRAEKAFGQQILYDEPEEEYGEIVGIGNSSGHYMNEDYRRGHDSGIEPPSPPLPHPGVPFDRVEPGGNYISGVNRARGVNGRVGSMERLAERFSEQRHGGSPGHRPYAPMPGQLPPSIPRTMTNPATMIMPMAGLPPPSLRRHHTVEEDLSSPHMQMIERPPARRRTNDFMPEDNEWPSPSSQSTRSQQSRRREFEMGHQDPLADGSAAEKAGLAGDRRGNDRVVEWQRHVELDRRNSVPAQ